MKIIRLENRNDGHSKFYEMWASAYVNNNTGTADKAFVGIRYGKIGTNGHTELIEFEGEDCKAKAHSLVMKKEREKLAKGYELVGDRQVADQPGTVGIDQEPGANSNQLSMMEV